MRNGVNVGVRGVGAFRERNASVTGVKRGELAVGGSMLAKTDMSMTKSAILWISGPITLSSHRGPTRDLKPGTSACVTTLIGKIPKAPQYRETFGQNSADPAAGVVRAPANVAESAAARTSTCPKVVHPMSNCAGESREYCFASSSSKRKVRAVAVRAWSVPAPSVKTYVNARI